MECQWSPLAGIYSFNHKLIFITILIKQDFISDVKLLLKWMIFRCLHWKQDKNTSEKHHLCSVIRRYRNRYHHALDLLEISNIWSVNNSRYLHLESCVPILIPIYQSHFHMILVATVTFGFSKNKTTASHRCWINDQNLRCKQSNMMHVSAVLFRREWYQAADGIRRAGAPERSRNHGHLHYEASNTASARRHDHASREMFRPSPALEKAHL